MYVIQRPACAVSLPNIFGNDSQRAQKTRGIEMAVLQLPQLEPYVKSMFTWIFQDMPRQIPQFVAYHGLNGGSSGNSRRRYQMTTIIMTADRVASINRCRNCLQPFGFNPFNMLINRFRLTMPLYNFTFGQTPGFVREKFFNVNYRNNAVKLSIYTHCPVPD